MVTVEAAEPAQLRPRRRSRLRPLPRIQRDQENQ